MIELFYWKYYHKTSIAMFLVTICNRFFVLLFQYIIMMCYETVVCKKEVSVKVVSKKVTPDKKGF